MKYMVTYQKVIMLFLVGVVCVWKSFADTEEVNGIVWTYTVNNGEASIGTGLSGETAIPKTTSGEIIIPATLGGYSVSGVEWHAFDKCSAKRGGTGSADSLFGHIFGSSSASGVTNVGSVEVAKSSSSYNGR